MADLFWRVRADNVPAIPPVVHTHDEVRRWARERLLPSYAVWVADTGTELVGFVALGAPDWIEQIYVRGDAAGQGLGGRFLDLAKRELGGQVQLWTFQDNTRARRFYARHGFVEVAWTDGDNEEGAPDVRLLYTPG